MSENGHSTQPKQPHTAYRELVSQAPFALRDLISALGYPIEVLPGGDLRVSVATLTVIADELAELVGKAPAWGWRYLRDVLNKKTAASARLTQSIFEWGAIVDGTPAVMANTEDVSVRAKPGQLHPGAVVLAGSKRCANPKCRVAFVPRVPNQLYCRVQCRRQSLEASE